VCSKFELHLGRKERNVPISDIKISIPLLQGKYFYSYNLTQVCVYCVQKNWKDLRVFREGQIFPSQWIFFDRSTLLLCLTLVDSTLLDSASNRERCLCLSICSGIPLFSRRLGDHSSTFIKWNCNKKTSENHHPPSKMTHTNNYALRGFVLKTVGSHIH
jgi:hypothetical protein